VHGEDGKPREVKIWIVVSTITALRTRNTSWRVDLERDPKPRLKIAARRSRSGRSRSRTRSVTSA
jgi:hypothetical protein